jgi:hypothetical protein
MPAMAVTELGILYQNRPEHGVRPANRGSMILAGFSGRFSKSADFSFDRSVGFFAKSWIVVNLSSG